MSTDQVELAAGAVSSDIAAADPYSAEWWESRTAAELRDIIKHGFRHGHVYDCAVAETERRAREAVRRLRQEESATEQRNARTRLVVLAAVLAIVIGVGLVDWLLF
jgi:CHASE3 domain sensor protein